ncbi:hypothetical protein NEHOM01_0331 [Nematocida homosporus]|uniref:uncharacterized protein n=1 Tax=Nematocida homosporus TaxID=1912981 RepID=UPI00221FCBFE|nr:uncharacterized protein NEHOM01_0331 [Nematocida homosporus]KAI5184729.1 hypothetical protein NEHOM01_0331 [Nematocida homosporus]
MQAGYEEERDSSEDFEIVLNDEQEVPETADLLEAYALDCDAFSDKPWRRPGEDITDYFNYGFTESTWAEYVSKQKRLREEHPNRARKRDKEWAPRTRRR